MHFLFYFWNACSATRPAPVNLSQPVYIQPTHSFAPLPDCLLPLCTRLSSLFLFCFISSVFDLVLIPCLTFDCTMSVLVDWILMLDTFIFLLLLIFWFIAFYAPWFWDIFWSVKLAWVCLLKICGISYWAYKAKDDASVMSHIGLWRVSLSGRLRDVSSIIFCQNSKYRQRGEAQVELRWGGLLQNQEACTAIRHACHSKRSHP